LLISSSFSLAIYYRLRIAQNFSINNHFISYYFKLIHKEALSLLKEILQKIDL